MSNNIKDKQKIDICLDNVKTIKEHTDVFLGAFNGLLSNDKQGSTRNDFNRLIKQNEKALDNIEKYIKYMNKKYGQNEIEPMIDETHMFDDIKKESIKIKVD